MYRIAQFVIMFSVPLLLGCQSQVFDGENEAADVIKPRHLPNVILITISSLRADHVGAYGYHRDTTPHFDAFAEKSFLFTNAFAVSSWQMPAMGSIMASLYPSQHGATHIDKRMKQCETLPTMLKSAGYYTAGFTCNPRLREVDGFAQGYDFYDDFSVNLMLESVAFDDNTATININQHRTNDLLNDAVIRWMEKNSSAPYFLSVHYYDNHWDYLPPAPYNKLFNANYSGTIDGTLISKEPLYSNKPSDKDIAQIIALYDGQVRQTDQDLGEFLNILEKSGRFEDSVIVVMGDHGEQFYEHGNTSHHGLYNELLHVPLAISFPQRGSSKFQSLVSGMDIMPTILAYAGISVPSSCEGKSLMPIVEGDGSEVREYLFFEYTGGAIPDIFAAQSRDYKYVQPSDTEPFGFDLRNDPGEQRYMEAKDFNDQLLTLQEYCRSTMSRLKVNQQPK